MCTPARVRNASAPITGRRGETGAPARASAAGSTPSALRSSPQPGSIPASSTAASSIGSLPVRSPIPPSVPFTAAQPASHAAVAFACTLPRSSCPCHSSSAGPTPADSRQRRDEPGHAAGQLGLAPRQPEPERVAQAQLDRDAAVAAELDERRRERQHEPVEVGAGDVLEVHARADAGVDDRADKVECSA